MGKIRYKIDVLNALKTAGWNTTRLGAKGEKIFGESTIQGFREKKPLTFDVLARVCELLGCQPGDILEYVEDEQ